MSIVFRPNQANANAAHMVIIIIIVILTGRQVSCKTQYWLGVNALEGRPMCESERELFRSGRKYFQKVIQQLRNY